MAWLGDKLARHNLPRIEERQLRWMQATHSIVSFYHLNFGIVKSSSTSNLLNCPAIISPFLHKFELLCQERQTIPPIRSNTHVINFVMVRPKNVRSYRYPIFRNMKWTPYESMLSKDH